MEIQSCNHQKII